MARTWRVWIVCLLITTLHVGISDCQEDVDVDDFAVYDEEQEAPDEFGQDVGDLLTSSMEDDHEEEFDGIDVDFDFADTDLEHEVHDDDTAISFEKLKEELKNMNAHENNGSPKPDKPKKMNTNQVETVKVQTPDPKTPVAKTPDAQTPVAKTPDAQAPVAKTPDAQTPVIKEVKTPEVNAPKVENPETIKTVDVKGSNTPEIKVPEQKEPSIHRILNTAIDSKTAPDVVAKIQVHHKPPMGISDKLGVMPANIALSAAEAQVAPPLPAKAKPESEYKSAESLKRIQAKELRREPEYPEYDHGPVYDYVPAYRSNYKEKPAAKVQHHQGYIYEETTDDDFNSRMKQVLAIFLTILFALIVCSLAFVSVKSSSSSPDDTFDSEMGYSINTYQSISEYKNNP